MKRGSRRWWRDRSNPEATAQRPVRPGGLASRLLLSEVRSDQPHPSYVEPGIASVFEWDPAGHLRGQRSLNDKTADIGGRGAPRGKARLTGRGMLRSRAALSRGEFHLSSDAAEAQADGRGGARGFTPSAQSGIASLPEPMGRPITCSARTPGTPGSTSPRPTPPPPSDCRRGTVSREPSVAAASPRGRATRPRHPAPAMPSGTVSRTDSPVPRTGRIAARSGAAAVDHGLASSTRTGRGRWGGSGLLYRHHRRQGGARPLRVAVGRASAAMGSAVHGAARGPAAGGLLTFEGGATYSRRWKTCLHMSPC